MAHTSRIPSQRNVFAFTLIELLVVIAIIAILAAILFPVFAQARQKARQAACLSNLKQIGSATMMYVQDYDETMPGNNSLDEGAGLPKGFMDPACVRNYFQSVYAYTKNLDIYVCPNALPYTATGSSSSAYSEVNVTGGGNTSYAMNYIIADRAFAVIPSPASVVMLHEFSIYQRASQLRPYPTGTQYTMFTNTKLDLNHQAGANRLYCDGHAKWSKKTAMTYADFGAASSCTYATTNFSDDANVTATQQWYTCAAGF